MYVYYTVLPVVKNQSANETFPTCIHEQLQLGNIILLQTIYCSGDFPVPMHVQLLHLPPNLLLCDILPVNRPSSAGSMIASRDRSLIAIFVDTATYTIFCHRGSRGAISFFPQKPSLSSKNMALVSVDSCFANAPYLRVTQTSICDIFQGHF